MSATSTAQRVHQANLEQQITNALKRWSEDPEKHAQSSAEFLHGVLEDPGQDAIEAMFSDLNCVLFRRLIIKEYEVEGALRVQNPLFLVAAEWFESCPDESNKVKSLPFLRKTVLDALDQIKGDTSREVYVIKCLKLVETLMNEPGFPEFALTFLKIQRFSVDALGRHLRRNESSLDFSAQSSFVSTRILFRHASRVLYDPSSAVMSFFESYPRWPDHDTLRDEVLSFLLDHAEAIHAQTAVFAKYRPDILRTFTRLANLESKNKLLGLVKFWSQENVAAVDVLMLEALSEDPVRGEIAFAVFEGAAQNAQALVSALASAVRAEVDGAIQCLPRPVLRELEALADNADGLNELERCDLVAEWASGLLSMSPTSAAVMSWFLGEAGSKRGWKDAFGALRAVLAVVNLSRLERRAAGSAVLKFALDANSNDNQCDVDYRSLAAEAFAAMPVEEKDEEGYRRRCMLLVHSQYRGANVLQSAAGFD